MLFLEVTLSFDLDLLRALLDLNLFLKSAPPNLEEGVLLLDYKSFRKLAVDLLAPPIALALLSF